VSDLSHLVIFAEASQSRRIIFIEIKLKSGAKNERWWFRPWAILSNGGGPSWKDRNFN
jgi:hypothetical protein